MLTLECVGPTGDRVHTQTATEWSPLCTAMREAYETQTPLRLEGRRYGVTRWYEVLGVREDHLTAFVVPVEEP